MPATPDMRHTYSLSDAPGPDRDLLGGKGAGLVEMVSLRLPVPPAFIITTACGREYLRERRLPDDLLAELRQRIAELEVASGRRFGDAQAPMLVSVRSGAPVSMPGMMDTVLNVGLTAQAVDALARETGDEAFAVGCWERLLEGFATVVRGVSRGVVEDALMDLPACQDAVEASRARSAALVAVIEAASGAVFSEPEGQLLEAIEAVFASWDSRRAKAYRQHKGISDDIGTAVVVQLMVFGNRGESSGSGVAFTRDPSTGTTGAYGDFLFTAQGEEVVSGEHDTLPLSALEERLPSVAGELRAVFSILERDTCDLCDVEFTVEQGKLWILQTRPGQRSGRAAVRIATAFVHEGLIDVEEALARVTDEQLTAAQAPVFAEEPPEDVVIARGLPASPGAAVGMAALDPDRACRLQEDGHDVILVRPTTSPADLPGVLSAVGVVTGRGGRTSHAAVVARGLGRPAVCGVGDVRIAPDGLSATLGQATIREGDELSVDGDRGIVSLGRWPVAPAHDADPSLARFLQWRAERTAGVSAS
jgi:pyruvate,orthophosphate dikinase